MPLFQVLFRTLRCRCRHIDPEISVEPELEPATESDQSSDRTSSQGFSTPRSEPVRSAVTELHWVGTGISPSNHFGIVGREPSSEDLVAGARVYAVWKVDGIVRSDIAGIHWSFDLAAYGAILSLNQGDFGGIRFRRFYSVTEAQRQFRAEAPRHGVDAARAEIFIFWRYHAEGGSPRLPSTGRGLW